MSIYDPYNGKTRKEYLNGLADDFGISYEIVKTIADILGEEEDFDGLISELNDYLETRE
jgi:hypothetical protein